MAVNETKIITDNSYFITETNNIIAQRDEANNKLNEFLDPIVTELGGDPAHLKFASKKINYILENENEWASTNTLGAVKFNYENRLKTINNLARRAEEQIKMKQKSLDLNGELIEQLSQEIQGMREGNLRIEQENAAINAKIEAYEKTVESIDKEIEALNNQPTNNNNKNKANYNVIKSTMERKTATLDKIAELKGTLAQNKLKIISDNDISKCQNRLKKYQQKQLVAYNEFQNQKINLINEFKKDKIELNLGDSATEPKKDGEESPSNETAGKEGKVKGGSAVGGGAVAQVPANITGDQRTEEQLVQDMYRRFTETGKMDAEMRKRILSGMGYSDLSDMASKMSFLKRHNVNRLLNATLKDLGKLDNARANKIDELLEKKFGVSDGYSLLAEGDFSKLSEEQLSDIKTIIDTFNKDPDNYTREEQIMIDEFAKRVSLKSLSYQMKKSGAIGRLVEYFTPGSQSRKDVHSSFNTFSVEKANRVKEVAKSDFATEMKANVKSDSEISMDSRSSLTTKQQQRSMGMRR